MKVCTLKMLPWCSSSQLHTRRPCMSVDALEVRHLESEAVYRETRKRLVSPARSSHAEPNSSRMEKTASRYEMASTSRRVFCSGRALTKHSRITRAVHHSYEQFSAADAIRLFIREANNASASSLQISPPRFGNARSELFTDGLEGSRCISQLDYSQTPLQRTLLLLNSVYNEACRIDRRDSCASHVL